MGAHAHVGAHSVGDYRIDRKLDAPRPNAPAPVSGRFHDAHDGFPGVLAAEAPQQHFPPRQHFLAVPVLTTRMGDRGQGTAKRR